MPRIEQFEAPVKGLTPQQSGASAIAEGADTLARMARYKGAMATEAGNMIKQGVGAAVRGGEALGDEIERHDTMSDISVGSAALANAHSDLTSDWNNTVNSADLNDHTIAQSFNQEKLEPFLQKWQEGFHTEQGQKWAMEQADQMRMHFFTKQSADMMTRQSDAAVANFSTTINAYSQTVRDDPTAMDHAQTALKASVEGLVANSGMSADAASKLRTETLQKGEREIATAALQGMAEKNPDAAEAAVNSGKFAPWMNDSEVHGALNYIKAQRQAQEQSVRENRILANQERELNYRNNGAAMVSSIGATPDGKLVFPQGFARGVIDQVSKGGLPWEQGKAMIEWQNREQQSDTRVDRATTPGLVNQLLGRMDLPDGDPRKLSSAGQLYPMVSRTDGGPNLSQSDLKFMQEQLNAPDRVGNMPIVKAELGRSAEMITNRLDPTNPAVRGAIDQFKADTLRRLQAVRAGGGDVGPYLDPADKNYLFSPDRINQYIPSKDAYAAHTISGAAAPSGQPAVRPDLPDIWMLSKGPPPQEQK